MSDVEAHTRRINSVLARKALQHGYAFEGATVRTPLDELLAKDEPEDAQCERRETLQALNRFFVADGPSPGAVVRRVFAVLRAVNPELIAHMTVRELALMFDETPAAQSWRIKKIFSDYLRERGVKGFKAPFQKSEAARAAYSRAQQGNRNRSGRIRTAA